MWLGSPFRAFCASRFSPARRLQPATMHLCGGFVGRQLFRYFARPAQRDSPEPLMYDVRFIRKDGQRVDAAIVRKRFFEPALEPGASPVRAPRNWNDMLFGAPTHAD